MGDKEIGQAKIALEFFEQVYDLRADADIEGRNRLITDNKFRTQDQGASNTDALTLSTGELVRIATERGFIETNRAHHFNGCAVEFARSRALAVCVDQQRLGNNFFYAHARVERGKGILKDDLHIAAQAAKLTGAGGKDIFTVEGDGAGSGFDEAKNHPPQRSLAATRFAYQA